MLNWLRENWGNVVKGMALGFAGIGFFMSLKVDVAVSQADISSIQSDVTELKADVADTNNKVDRLYDVFIAGKFAINGR